MRLSLVTSLTPAVVARFRGYVDDSAGPDACWPWTAFRDPRGYGRFMLNDRPQVASRVALAIDGRLPDGAHALHSCDNPPCCNPGHLAPGSHAENMAEAAARKRMRSGGARGELHGCHRLTEAQVRVIKELLRAGDRQRRIAAEFGVSEATINHINTGRKWAFVP